MEDGVEVEDRLGGAGRGVHFFGRLCQKTCIEVVCCYVSHHPTVLSPLSHLRCDNRKLVYFLVNSSCLYVLFCKFISCITLTFRFNSLSAKSILAGEKLPATYSISTQEQYIIFYVKQKLGAPKSTYRHNAQIGVYRTILTSAKKIQF